MNRDKKRIREDLYCPACGHKGMYLLADKAQSGRSRYSCMNCRSRTTKPSYTEVQVLPKTKVTKIKKHKFFVITSAVNDTPIVRAAHETFKSIAKNNNGCYLVIPGVYKNPDLKHQGVTNNYTWPEEIMPYLCNADVQLNKNLMIKGKTRIQYTVINPLAGLNHAGSMQSEIYAHPQVCMQMIATPKNKLPKMLHTTGSISQPNYGNSVRAQKAEFHHSISALIIEIQGDKFWTREVHFDGEGAYDLNRYYRSSGTFSNRLGHSVAAIVYGDVHVQALEPKVDTLLKKVSAKLKPEYEIYHDLHDQNLGSHHKEKDLIFGLSQSIKNNLSIKDELMLAVKFLDERDNAYLVDSNHHRHLDQWFNRFNPKNDLVNAPLYFELAELLQKDLKENGNGDLFRLFCQKYCKKQPVFVDCDDEFLIRGIDCSQHGDRGANGARGSAKGFAKSGHKTIIGHGHSPTIEKGCYQVGVMSPDLAYAKGMSSWLNTHAIIYDNGKRALFSLINNQLSPTMRLMLQ